MKNYIMPNFSKNYHKKNWKDQTAIQIEELIALPQIKKKKFPSLIKKQNLTVN